MSMSVKYNGINITWQENEAVTPLLAQMLQEYKFAYETAAKPSTSALLLHKLVEFAKNEHNGYCGIYCYVFKVSTVSQIVKYIKPYKTVTVQNNGGFIAIAADICFKDETNPDSAYYKPIYMFFRQDDIAWLRIVFDKHDIKPLETSYIEFSGRERPQAALYEPSAATLPDNSIGQPISVVWATNAGELIFSIFNNDTKDIIERTNMLENLESAMSNENIEPDSMIEMITQIQAAKLG